MYTQTYIYIFTCRYIYIYKQVKKTKSTVTARRASTIFDFFMNLFSKDLAQSSVSGNPIDSFHPLGEALKNKSKVNKWSQITIRDF